MTTPKTKCYACGAEILQATADARGGRCAPCVNGTRAQVAAARARAQQPTPARPPPPTIIPTATAIAGVLDAIIDPASEHDLDLLAGALAAIPSAPDAADCGPALLRLFERFPWSDGFESFWGVLHALETQPGYESLLVPSVRRSPGEFNLLMLNSLLNGGVREVDGVSLLSVLEEVAGAATSDQVRNLAASYLRHQRRQGSEPG